MKNEPPAEFTPLVIAVNRWQRVMFPFATPHSVARHLAKEVRELAASHAPSEAADCLLLLMGHADRQGYDLLQATRDKFREVQGRQWSAPDADGVVEHIRGDKEAAADDGTIRTWHITLTSNRCEFTNVHLATGGRLIDNPVERRLTIQATRTDAMQFYRLLGEVVMHCSVTRSE